MLFKKSKLQKIFSEIFKLNYITKDNEILDFENFFQYLDSNLKNINANFIIKEYECAKGISSEVFFDSIKNNNAIKFNSLNNTNANVIKISFKNFGFTWSYGFTKKQNLGFTIYFNKSDLISKNNDEIEISTGYDEEYLNTLAAASPQAVEEYIKNGVLRVNGFLNSNKIKAIGFRFKNENDEFEIKLYALN